MKAVIFDLFETLVTEWVSDKYTKRMAAKDLGADYGAFDRKIEEMEVECSRGSISYRQALVNACRAAGREPDGDALTAAQEKQDVGKAQCFTYKHTDIEDMLLKLKGMGLRLGIISNCWEEEIRHLPQSGVFLYFDAVILSCSVGLIKPEREIYTKCAAMLGLEPKDCLYVGDGGSRELWGAKEAGMKPVRAMWFVKKYRSHYESMPFPEAQKPSDVVRFAKEKMMEREQGI